MKQLSIFILLLYWSFIILAPLLNKNTKVSKLNNSIFPVEKPLN